MTPVRIEQVSPLDLHDVWRFVFVGLEKICRKVKPDWKPEDLYASIRGGFAQLYLVTRGQRRLGFFVNYVQRRTFSNKPELFLWCAYSIPLRERLQDDDVPDAVRQSMDFMREQARAAKADGIIFLSTRRGFGRFGFRPSFTTWKIPLIDKAS